MPDPLLTVDELQTHFHTDNGTARAVDGISFTLNRGETLGLVGESGCGKSVTSLSIMQLVPPPGRIEGGRIFFNNRDLLSVSANDMRNVRGNDIAMIFQEPMTSLNPVYTCGFQIDEAVIRHRDLNAKDARNKTVEMLHLVGIPDPEHRANEYPHQLSGGQRQRVMIAMALSCNPDVLIADEPTTALDVTIQAQILDLLRDLQQQLGMAVLLITHDLGVIAEVADRVAVMYAGKIVEAGSVDAIFHDPKHPYTQGLLTSVPRLDFLRERLATIPGTVPDATHFPPGCRFADRCTKAEPQCRETLPTLETINTDHQAACWVVS
ncbi:MAG: ABC transporter ATP-binding protein [Candidatus Latescibacteria bacterium]|nr:ABC transporter ATP-binding protein [Candidatus Latescibacterota bacterium]